MIIASVVTAVGVLILFMFISESGYSPPPSRTTGGYSSCPFTYSFDGEKYIFDAEPYGGAICKRLERTEWCGLENIKDINGQYRIMVMNEMEETQYMDELKLVVVDHPKGAKVVPSTFGQMHTISHPAAPVKAHDRVGNDLLPLISKNDRLLWQSRVKEKNPEIKEDLREELIFEFPKPAGVKKAKLLVNACPTVWASEAGKMYLDLYGDRISDWYEDVNSSGPSFFRMRNMQVREELNLLQIRVETEDGWKSKGLIIGGGPFISEDKVYPLDINDVPGDVLRIKLTPLAAFWVMNYLAVDYSEDLPVEAREIEAREAIDHKGKDVREILAKNDNNYLIMPNIGDRAELVFDSPPQRDGMVRTVLLKASGYYDIHLEAKGETQVKTIERLEKEPGYAVRYAFKEYLKWREEIMKDISRQ